MPFNTASLPRALCGYSVRESMKPSTSPFAGEMRAMRSSYQMFAQISPSMYSSSFNFGTGDAVGAHLDLARDGERLRVAEADRGRAVAHDELLAVVREPPPFAVVLHRALDFERFEVVDDHDAVLPRELVERAAENRDAFAEVRGPSARCFSGRPVFESTRRIVDAPYCPVPS